MTPVNRARAVGYLRLAVGLTMMALPKPVARLGNDDEPSGSLILLMRTIGIRDLALGLGAVAASRASVEETRRWIGMGLLSDVLDTLAGVAAKRHVRTRGALIAAGVPLPVILADLWALAGLSTAARAADA